jgi:hypothetical protein
VVSTIGLDALAWLNRLKPLEQFKKTCRKNAVGLSQVKQDFCPFVVQSCCSLLVDASCILVSIDAQ